MVFHFASVGRGVGEKNLREGGFIQRKGVV
jgi:hypothetical protein